jgi:hypothetical protein
MRNECTLSLLTKAIPSPPTGGDYRELAAKIRELARQTRLPVARYELARLAASYERRGGHLDQLTYHCYQPRIFRRDDG